MKGYLLCSWCKQTKPKREFYRRKSTKRGYYGYCKTCAHDPERVRLAGKRRYPKHTTMQGRQTAYRQQAKDLARVGLKHCPKCCDVLPLDEFYKDRRNKTTGRMSYCKQCQKALTCGEHLRYCGDTCGKCGFERIGKGQMDVHHVDGDHSNNDPSNLITLCANCHRLVHHDRGVYDAWVVGR